MYVTITIPGSDIVPGDVLKRYPSAAVAEAANVDPQYPNSRTLRMASGTWYFCSPVQEYIVTRDVEDTSTPARVLVVGPTATRADVERLRDVARSVAYELGRPATYATHTDYDVTGFAAVYSVRPLASLRTAPALVLVAEALLAGVEVSEPLKADEVTTCGCGLVSRHTRPHVDARGLVWCAECLSDDACAHCGEAFDMEDAEIVERDATFFPVHAGCRALHRSTSRRLVAV